MTNDAVALQSDALDGDGAASNDDGQSRLPPELLIWFAPSFPTGGFAFSQGLETAAAEGFVTDRESLLGWLNALLESGSIRNDLIFASLSYRAAARAPDADIDLAELIQWSLALQPTAERAREAVQLGRNFRDAVLAGWPQLKRAFASLGDEDPTYPVASGLAAASLGLPLEATLAAYVESGIANACSAAVRLSVIGQFDGVRIQSGLRDDVERAIVGARTARIDDVSSTTFTADILSMRHETQMTRLFQS
ncbi:MAG: urease accessory UreF family protein [Pseudomonadota bacterium]